MSKQKKSRHFRRGLFFIRRTTGAVRPSSYQGRVWTQAPAFAAVEAQPAAAEVPDAPPEEQDVRAEGAPGVPLVAQAVAEAVGWDAPPAVLDAAEEEPAAQLEEAYTDVPVVPAVDTQAPAAQAAPAAEEPSAASAGAEYTDAPAVRADDSPEADSVPAAVAGPAAEAQRG